MGGKANSGEQPRLEPQTYAAVPAQAMQDSRLRATDWRVLIAISFRADAEGIAWPSQGDLARLTGRSRQKVTATVNRLCEFGYIEKTKMRRRKGRFSLNCYRVIRKKPVDHAPPGGDTDHAPPGGDTTMHPPGVTLTDH